MNAVAKTLKWQGRTLGLSKAYKQVPLNENAQAMCVLGDFHKGEWNYYTTSRLPFAATSAVYTFTRISRSIHHILCRSLRVLCTCFYDDFPALSTTFGAALVSKSMSVILGLLSWEPAKSRYQGCRLCMRVFGAGHNNQTAGATPWAFYLSKQGRQNS